MVYNTNNLLRLAKRNNNKKRKYLLVNPLQGKHMPVKALDCLSMMDALGNKVSNKFTSAKLVIGFAETATALGAVVAYDIHLKSKQDCFYIQTTREDIIGDHNWIYFKEEHSHAVDQKLCIDKLKGYIDSTDTIILVDDELSTGKTILNIV